MSYGEYYVGQVWVDEQKEGVAVVEYVSEDGNCAATRIQSGRNMKVGALIHYYAWDGFPLGWKVQECKTAPSDESLESLFEEFNSFVAKCPYLIQRDYSEQQIQAARDNAKLYGFESEVTDEIAILFLDWHYSKKTEYGTIEEVIEDSSGINGLKTNGNLQQAEFWSEHLLS
ncbi:hypothetical protein ACQ4M3_01050 [Leptolyngbya sp. AN03gr2]|uniref:hypothetical protein n=1 Tax=unclassified Leptolyngbya TaxID=2650499 RepID=UPI003D3202E1